MRKFIHTLMTDKADSPVLAPFKMALYLASLVYGLGIYARSLLYRFGIFNAKKVPIKVISVGNLTLGGTGKTPFVILLAGMLEKELSANPSVLIRGYGWDEQAMLKADLPDIPVLVNKDRARAARRAVKLYGSTVAVMDDGFQHWELARDLDIVLVDSRNAFGNRHLFPRGVLREPISALRRAGIVVFTKTNKKRCDLAALKDEMRSFNPDLIFLEAAHTPRHFNDAKLAKKLPLEEIRSKRVILLSSIGDPEYFEETVKDLGAEVIDHIAFADHHNYTQADISRVIKRCDERAFDHIVTTEKDAVKLTRMHFSFGRHYVLTLEIDMSILSGREKLVDRLHSLYTR